MRGEEGVERSQIKNHITVLAMNQRGYQKLLRLVTQYVGASNSTITRRSVSARS